MTLSKKITFSIFKFAENFSTTAFGATFGATIFRADTGNNRKIANFTYSPPYAKPIKLEIAKQLLSNF